MTESLEKLFAHNSWANEQLVLFFSGASIADVHYLALLNHIIGTEFLWYDRLHQVERRMEVWPQFSIEECAGKTQEISTLWDSYLESLTSDLLAREIPYVNSKGESWSNRVEDVLHHVIQHSTYHRGQLSLRVRDCGVKPAYVDFIHSVRQKFI